MILTGNKYGKLIQKESGKVAHYSAKSWNVINNKWFDISGLGNHATISGASLDGDGMVFDGVNDYGISVNNVLIGTGDFTIETNVSIIDLNSTERDIIGVNKDSGFVLGVLRSIGIFFYTVGDTNATTGAISYYGEYVNIVATRTSGTKYLYINGSLVDSKASTGNILTGKIDIGRQQTRFYHAGKIGDIKMYNIGKTP